MGEPDEGCPDRVQKETYVSVAEKRRGWNRAARARKKGANGMATYNALGARKNVARDTVAVRSKQVGSAEVIESNLAPNSEAAAGATPADVRSVQVTGDVKSQQRKGGNGAHQEEEDEDTEDAPGLGGQGPATVAEAVAMDAPMQASDDVVLKADTMMEKLKRKSLALHRDLFAEKTSYACALLDNVCPQREMTKGFEKKEKSARLLAMKKVQ